MDLQQLPRFLPASCIQNSSHGSRPGGADRRISSAVGGLALAAADPVYTVFQSEHTIPAPACAMVVRTPTWPKFGKPTKGTDTGITELIIGSGIDHNGIFWLNADNQTFQVTPDS
jgi:hypothetical protein